MRKFIYSLIILFSTTYYGFAEIPAGAEKIEEGEYNVFMLSDAGRNGSYDQRKIGTLMGEYAEIPSSLSLAATCSIMTGYRVLRTRYYFPIMKIYIPTESYIAPGTVF